MVILTTNKEGKALSAQQIIASMNPRYLSKDPADFGKFKPAPVWTQKLVYDSTSETLEPIYFWLLDFVKNFGWDVTKLVDNFTAAPGSGHFAELGMRATRMQEEGMKILGSINTVIKSVLNLIYDLKEFEIRLKHYDEYKKTTNPEIKEAALLALKQIWMDNVDIKRGRGSINMLTYELSFTTLRDAFMVVKSLEDVEKVDLNERVKRILKPRVAEFFEWLKRSEMELRKRFEIEKTYLKSQVNAIKLYSRWAKPYFRAAEQLRMAENNSADIINIFNTIMLNLSLFCVKSLNPKEMAYNKQLPLKFANKKFPRKYYGAVFIDFEFRGIPRRISPQEAHYVFGGRSEINFAAYTLNEDELFFFKNYLDRNDLRDALNIVDITTKETMEQLVEDIEYFTGEKSKEDIVKEQPMQNPFSALFGFKKNPMIKPKTKKETEEYEKQKFDMFKKTGITRDSHAESLVRAAAEFDASDFLFKAFDIYKKAHDMASIPGGIDFEEHFKTKWKPGLA